MRPTSAGVAWRPGAGLITPIRRLPSLATLGRALLREAAAQWDRLPLWTPVAFGAGAAIYLDLAREPAVGLALGLGLAASALAILSRRFVPNRAMTAGTAMIAALAMGFLVAKLHSDAVATPVTPAGLGVTTIEGFVVDVESPSERGPRLLIAPVRIERLSPSQTPGRIRIVVPQTGGPEATPSPGSAIQVTTLLDPPPGPAAPGAYDFARDAWFEGVGGVGLAMRPPSRIDMTAPLPLRPILAMNALRWSVALHLARAMHSVMGDDDNGAAGLAVAVTTSHQDWLPSEDRDALRALGLAHMLAIAGLHTAAVSGFAFFAFRLMIAAWPWLALRVSGKKVAAAAALVIVAGYLILSGAHPPARRAAITASIAFLAILADRRAVSLRSLALAALVVLFTEPESVLQPGFEMSFCATASLVAMAEIWPRRLHASGLAWPVSWLQTARDWLVAMVMVSLVAGAATGPFAIQHFNRVANYGVFANLTADFIASALLMPSLALCLIVQACGLGPGEVGFLFRAAGWAARSIIEIGRLFSSAPGAAIAMSSAPPLALAISYLGIVFACIWRGNLRWIGVPMAGAVALWPRPAAPIAWMSGDGGDAAIVANGEVVALKPHTRLYATQAWAQRRGLRLPSEPDSALRALFDCDRTACAPNAFAHPAIAAWWTKRAPKTGRLAALCAHADILILRADVPLPWECRDVRVFGRAAFERGGAAEIFATRTGWRVVWSQPLRGVRPWTVSDSAG